MAIGIVLKKGFAEGIPGGKDLIDQLRWDAASIISNRDDKKACFFNPSGISRKALVTGTSKPDAVIRLLDKSRLFTT